MQTAAGNEPREQAAEPQFTESHVHDALDRAAAFLAEHLPHMGEPEDDAITAFRQALLLFLPQPETPVRWEDFLSASYCGAAPWSKQDPRNWWEWSPRAASASEQEAVQA